MRLPSSTFALRAAALVLVCATQACLTDTSLQTGTSSAAPEEPTSTSPGTPLPPATPVPASARWVTGYYVGYQRQLYPETSVDFTYMTHVIVGAAVPTSTGGLQTHFYIDDVAGPAMAKSLAARAHQFGRKAIMMIGGDGWHDQLASASSNTNRARFVTNLVQAMGALGFDGIDVDWEPIDDADKPVILQLLKDLRAAKPGIIITFPIGWVNTNFAPDAWFAQVAPLVDQMNLMSYEMAGNWGGWLSWHGSALYGEAGNHPSSVAGSVAAYRRLGIAAAKLGVGVGAYGSCWQGVSTMLATIDGTRADVTAGDNDITYGAIVSTYYSSTAYRWDSSAHASYLSFAAPTGPARCTMISYDDTRAVQEKGAYSKNQGLGGVMLWTINEQRLPTGATGERDPLLRAAYTGVFQ